MFRLDDCMAYLASRNSKELSDAMEKRMSPLGITRVQWMALYYIYNHEEITQKLLADQMGSKEPTIVRLLDRMEKEGLVRRIKMDRRTNQIELTDKGRDYFVKGLKIAEEFMNDAIRGIPEAYLEHFTWVLDKMVDNTRY